MLLVTYHLKHDGFIHIQFRIAPAVPTYSCLVLCAMSHKLLLGPIHLIGHLRQEGAAAMTFADIDSMLVQLELVKTLYAAHGGEHGNLYIEIIQLITGNGFEARIAEGSRTGHLGHHLMQRHILAEMTDAAT